MVEWNKENAEKVDELYDNPSEVDSTPPSAQELTKVAFILDECKAEIAKLKYPKRDVIGDYRVTRFLRANGGKEKKAVSAFKVFLNKRIENDHFMEKAREMVESWTPEEMSEWYTKRENPMEHSLPYGGETSNGDILMWQFHCRFDTTGFIESRPDDRALDYDIWVYICFYEWIFMQLDKNSRKNKRMCYVLEVHDMFAQDTSLIKMFNSHFAKFMTALNDYIKICWCDVHSYLVMVNSSTTTRVLIKLFSPFISTRTRNKIVCIGDENKDSSKKKLLKYLPANLSPKIWGGTGENTLVEDQYKWVRKGIEKEDKKKVREEFIKAPTYDLLTDGLVNYKSLPNPALSKTVNPKLWC